MKSSAFLFAIGVTLASASTWAVGPGDGDLPPPPRHSIAENSSINTPKTLAASSSAATATTATTTTATPIAASIPANSAPTINNALPNNLGTQAPSTSSAMSILQVFLSLSVVLGLLIAVAYALKRFGPQPMKGGANVRIVGGLSLGGRERVLVLEIGEQWLVVGAAPGRVNALATLPKPNDLRPSHENAAEPDLANEKNFATWLKQIMEKRNGA